MLELKPRKKSERPNVLIISIIFHRHPPTWEWSRVVTVAPRSEHFSRFLHIRQRWAVVLKSQVQQPRQNTTKGTLLWLLLSPRDFCISVFIVYDEGRFALVEQNVILNAIVLIMQGTMPLFPHGNIFFFFFFKGCCNASYYSAGHLLFKQ